MHVSFTANWAWLSVALVLRSVMQLPGGQLMHRPDWHGYPGGTSACPTPATAQYVPHPGAVACTVVVDEADDEDDELPLHPASSATISSCATSARGLNPGLPM